MSSPAPKSPEQSEKSKKYDRQLRLWGDHGQKLLENAKVCLINATGLGTEILKSLILPGIGAFTIVDGEKVSEVDLGSNFFVEHDSVGTSRAQAATQCLLELNPDVVGDYIDESAEHVLSNRQDFFNNFNVVIAINLPEKVLFPLSKQLWQANIPLIVARCIGLIGYLRLQVKEHTVIEAHPDSENPDLRIDQPWPQLKEHLDKIDIEKLDKKERSHVPALTILHYYLQKYRDQHDGKLPSTRAEKDELRNMIKGSHKLEEGHLEENFEEAIHYVNTCVCKTKVPSHIQNILNDPKGINLTQDSSSFWVMCAALREFVETKGVLPLRGSLPDMAADTNSYITLQQLYQKQAQSHVENILRRATQLSRSLGQPADLITESEVKMFCKHASELHVLNGSCIADEYQSNSLDISSHMEETDTLFMYYMLIRGFERFVTEFNVYPGQFDDQVEPDVLKLKSLIGKLLTEWGGCSSAVKDEKVHEICRYGGAELHSVSAMIAGCAAHEAIKLITHQYKPLNHTLIFDGNSASTATFCF